MTKQEKSATNNQWSSSASTQLDNCSGNCSCNHSGNHSGCCKHKDEKSATNNQWTSTNS